MRLQFSTTSIANDFITATKPYYFDLSADDTKNILDSLMVSIAEFLKLKKNKDLKKTAIVFNDEKENFLVAAIVEYHESTDPEMKGNWSYVMTVDPEDVKDVTNLYTIESDDFHAVLDTTAYSLHNMRFTQKKYTLILIRKMFETILNWLDVNAKESEPVEVEFSGFFVATVEVENGVKVVAIDPDGAMKRLVKDDDALSK